MRRGWGASTAVVWACALLLVLSAPISSRAQGTSSELTGSAVSPADVESELEAARADALAGRCDQAEARLAELAGSGSRARLLAGLCLIRAGRYPEALSALDQIRGARDLAGSQVGDVELYRAVALYHLERYAEAKTAIAAADGLSSEPAELALYRGLLALRDGDGRRAAPDLEAAALLSPALTEPVASYYAGLAWQTLDQRANARAAFLRVIAIDGEDGAWGRQARELLGANQRHPYFVRGLAGLEYDDNVILRGGVTQFPSPDSPSSAGEKDGRALWSIDSGVQLLQVGKVDAGVTAGYSGNKHFDLQAFDAHYPRVGGYVVDRLNDKTTAQLRYEFGAAWVNDNPFLRTQLAEAGLSHGWNEAGTTTLAADWLWNDLRFKRADVATGPGAPGSDCTGGALDPNAPACGPPGIDEKHARDRDGHGVGAALEHRYGVPLPDALRGGLNALRLAGAYRYRYFVAQGSEWKHMSHVLTAAMELDFPLDLHFSTRVSYEFRDFANPSTFPDRQVADTQYALSSADRREHEVVVATELEKRLDDHYSISTRWTYLDNESNRRVYDYTRHIVGAYLNFRFD